MRVSRITKVTIRLLPGNQLERIERRLKKQLQFYDGSGEVNEELMEKDLVKCDKNYQSTIFNAP